MFNSIFLVCYKVLYEWGIQALTRGNISVDSFFVMSGLLVSYSLLKELKRNEGRFNIFSFYFHRCMRSLLKILHALILMN